MISPETRRNFIDFNRMYIEIELEIDAPEEIPNMVLDRVSSEHDQERLDDVLRWRDGDYYLEAVGYEFEGDDDDYESDDSGYGSDFSEVSDIED